MYNYIIKLVILTLLCSSCTIGEKSISNLKKLDQCVILLHGLARTSDSMEEMQSSLLENGFFVVNVDYPSREYNIEHLASTVISENINRCNEKVKGQVHFVTHSLGGILVRYYLAHNKLDHLGRVVMLSPPNQGSEVVDKLKDMPGFYFLNGPAGVQLGTGSESVPVSLPPVDYEVGVITGDETINFILSMLIPGRDDGKVSIERAKVEGMADFLLVHDSHPFIMQDEVTIYQTIYFLKSGRFDHAAMEKARGISDEFNEN